CYVRGVPVDWPRVLGDGPHADPASLPGYPFQHERYWFTPRRAPQAVAEAPVEQEVPGLRGLTREERYEQLTALVGDCVAEVLGHEAGQVDTDDDLTELGLTSFGALEIANRLNRITGLTLPPSAMFDHRTVAELVVRLDEDL